MTKHPVVVIGAGITGVTSLKQCLEHGFDAICFEKTSQFGGLWRFREEDEPGVASVLRSTIINTSKEMSAFSDFPPDPKYANYMPHHCLLEYLTSYVRHFNLEPHFRYNHEVLKVDKAPDYDDTGNWTVKFKNKEGIESEVVASGVLVATGHHVYPSQPSFPGLEEFGGKVLHSHSYKDFAGLERKRALVVGIGNSAMEIAVELGNVNTKVFLSTRRGAWVFGRMGPGGMPIDYFLTKFRSLVGHYFPKLQTGFLYRLVNHHFDHSLYNLKPSHSITAQSLGLCDYLPNHILSGAITVKGDIKQFTPTGVVFKEEEDAEVPIDVVILATGYNILMPMLESIIPVKLNEVDLYSRVFPPDLKHPTVAVIGLIHPNGSIFPTAEMQARWACGIIKRQLQLPPIAERWKEVQTYKRFRQEHLINSQRHTIEVNFIPYMDQMAEAIGCKPDLKKILFADPALFIKLLFGPHVAYQYRLTGPYAWEGARDAIMSVMGRTRAPFASRKHTMAQSPGQSHHDSALITFSILILLLALVYYLLF